MSPIQRVIGALQNRPETAEATEAIAGPAAEVKVEVVAEAKVETAELPKAEDAKVADEAPKTDEATSTPE